ncbi:hypothetical protein JQ633_13545 [Bradyrhizobium tropiciagri]|uniref:hypothetical protein n=1 Tax=Bradyrhizobium tropiciagri TaxID=312253 RepID=UPI001BAE2819|nr:hypothetical protein [Bradyrhizobium tropiciagri]MBR0871386.1 hypothetical protein [Bradyrhizobium tropiciagri]
MDNIRLPKHTIDKIERRWSSRVSQSTAGPAVSADEQLARLRAHRGNIRRYRRLLETKLTEVERRFIETRLEEERIALDGLVRAGIAISPLLETTRQAIPITSVREHAHE